VEFLNSQHYQQQSKATERFIGMGLFPLIVLVGYGIVFAVMPDKACLATESSAKIFLNMLAPLGMIFVLMLFLNLFLKPAWVAKFFGKGSGIKGILLSVAAGIISTGPIYAWYPLLSEIREKGAGDSSIAIFLYNRAVKPFLLPLMITYFGWLYVVILTVLMVLASVAVGYSISIFTKK
jgi:uncharacterized membrane protein YraQ (UPF0718 family)